METTYIKHHGIKGQKWGQRNGPPYPLNAGAHSAAEKRANPKLGGVSTSKASSTKQQTTEDTKNFVGSGNVGSLGFNAKKAPCSMEEDAKAVNPNFDPWDPSLDYSMNCTSCVMAYSLRRMGLDVEAKACPDGRYLDEMPEYFGKCLDREHSKHITFNMTKNGSEDLRHKIEEQCLQLCKDDKNGVGFIEVSSPKGWGHVFNWEKTNSGKIAFIDAQTNHVNDSTIDRYFKILARGKHLQTDTYVSRLDNSVPNGEKLKEACKNH